MIKNLKPILAEAGKIKIGGLGKPVKSRHTGKEFRPPVKYDEFLITTTQRDGKGDLIPDENLMKMLRNGDEKLRTIPILLHSDDIEEVFPTTYAAYRGKQLYCRGDGEKATRYELNKQGQRTGKSTTMNCPCSLLESKDCKPHGTLNCMIRAERHAVAGAVHKWRTTSWNSIRRTLASLHQIKGLFGTLRNIPLRLRLDTIKVTPRNEKPRTVFCGYVECAAEDFAAIQRGALAGARMMAETRALNAGAPPPEGYQNAIDVPGRNESSAEQARVAQEFYPAEPYDPETGEVLGLNQDPFSEPPDPEPGDEPDDADPDPGAELVPQDDPARADVVAIIHEIAIVKSKMNGDANRKDWEPRLKASKLDIWNKVCQHSLGHVPEGEPEVTRAQIDDMRTWLKRQKRNALLAMIVTHEIEQTDLERGSDAWDGKFVEIRQMHWASICENVIGAPIGYEQAMDEKLLDQVNDALDGAVKQLRSTQPTAPPGNDDG